MDADDLQGAVEVARELADVAPVGCTTKFLVVFLYAVAWLLVLLGIFILVAGRSGREGGFIIAGMGLAVAVLTAPFLILWIRRARVAR